MPVTMATPTPGILRRLEKTLLDGVAKSSGRHRTGELESPFFTKNPDTIDETRVTPSGFSAKEWETRLDDMCWELFQATDPISNHFERLDSIFSQLLDFHVHLRDEQTIHNVAGAAEQFFRRLPDQPLGLPGIENLPEGYFDDQPVETAYRTVVWPCLQVTTHYSANVMKVVLYRTVYGRNGSDGWEEGQLADLTAKMLERCCGFEAVGCEDACKGDGDHRVHDDTEHQRWLIVRCFLWASWQRLQMLYFFRKLYAQITMGTSAELGSLAALRSRLVSPELTIEQFTDQIAHKGRVPYACSYNFNLLRTDVITVGWDYRHFHNRFKQLHGVKKGRCDAASGDSCKGEKRSECERFAVDVEDQSMHDHVCPGNCPKLIWDEQSYLSVQGGRVVDTNRTDFAKRLLRFKAASRETLAISHTWAHGQGGRPSTGLNQCLHIRYIQLARDLGCDGYFIDTACIPEDHQLRKEAIQNINKTFHDSKVTLVVDKDLVSIDASRMYTELQECLLATILISDWNARAWTLLEAMKGRRNIYILCKRAVTVSYRELIEGIVSNGRIDIAVMALLGPHMKSYHDETGEQSDSVGIGISNPSLEMAGTWLSYRPASRLGDEIVIWSLMINQIDKLAQTAEELWRTQIGKSVTTGFLVSSAERLEKDGLSWAPATPFAAPKHDLIPSERAKSKRGVRRFYRAFTGEETECAIIDERGIFATWYVHEFDVLRDLPKELLGEETAVVSQLFKIWIKSLVGYRHGAIVMPKNVKKKQPWSMHRHFSGYSGGSDGHLVVVLGSVESESTVHRNGKSSDLSKWVWKGVHTWPEDVELPRLEEQKLWIA